MKLGKPTKRNRQNIANYLNRHQSLAMDDQQFIRYWEDLIAPSGKYEHEWLIGCIVNIMNKCSVTFFQVCSQPQGLTHYKAR